MLRFQINDRDVIGRAVGRIEKLAVRRNDDAPGALAGLDRIEHLVRLGVQNANRPGAASAGINLLPVRRDLYAHRSRTLRQNDCFQLLVIGAINDVYLPRRFRGNKCLRAVGEKIDRAWTPAHVKMGDHFESGSIDRKNLPVSFARDVKDFAVGPDAHAFRLFMSRDDFFHLAAGDVKHTGGADILVGDEQMLAVRADGEILRVRASRQLAGHLSLRDVDDRDAIGGLVSILIVIIVVVAFLENRIAVGIEFRWWFRRRAADGDVHRFSIRAGVDAAWAFADRDGGHSLAGGAINHRDIIRALVRDVDVIIFTRLASRRRPQKKNETANHDDRPPVNRCS